ncbi:MAG: zinc ABC transporter substrate-binding protein [Verrucomicrobiota bacterium]
MKTRLKTILLLLLSSTLITFALNAKAIPTEAQENIKYPYTIVTTCGMVTDIVTKVAGDKAQVMALMGEGVDPHLYKPTRDDMNKLLQADIIFYAGLMLEGRMTDAFVKMARKGIPVHAVTEEIPESYLLHPGGVGEYPDPHLWMDVSAWSQATAVVCSALCEFDNKNSAYYKNNLEDYQVQLNELDAYIKKVISSIPADQRFLITAHDAFGYFARAYDIEVKAPQGLSTESEAGVSDINELVEFIAKNKIKSIFVETSVADKNIRAIIEGVQSKSHTVSVGGTLFSDAMGEPETYEGTYIGMLDSNATTIALALGGNAPKKGLFGKLSSPKTDH